MFVVMANGTTSRAVTLTFIFLLFCLPVQTYRKSYCTTPGVGIGSGHSFGVDKMLKFLYDEQGTVRRAILYPDRSCYCWESNLKVKNLLL